MTIADMRDRTPFPQSFQTIRAIVSRFGPANVYIVSKAKSETRKMIMQWLTEHNFFTATGMLQSKVHFVREYADKRTVVDRYRIHYFVDDSIKIMRCLAGAPSIRKLVWFGAKPELLHRLDKKIRNSIVIYKSWSKLYKMFSQPQL